ncbi:MAG TPA: basic amino acid ABC transporter substrate-binding protein [Candidatus Avacidaminococcus intestinavium]|uniref:Basic amino acid ABC transporter substrate-binding protein n=1 Tax=Candidatus Avacidaminococcus intestinavium TaxID=2840684 RepID=A0A9D1MNK9_9FIRM|nr:basic amino acid ABC transporter substrate-binding protein [Candidatus Avacidaminococcus intestinavium]
MKKILKVVVGLITLTVALALVGCGGEKQSKNELLVGTEPAFAPFEFQAENSQEFTGFDIDLIKALGKEMGYEKTTIQSMGFDALIPALEAKNIDVAIAGITITEERAQKIIFSQPYYRSGLAVVVNQENDSIRGVEDLKGKKIAVQIGTTGAMMAETIEGAEIKTFNSNGEACLELKNKAVDAVIGDLPVESYFLQQQGNNYAKIVGETLSSENYGIAIAKNNPDLAKKLNQALETLKENGEYNKIYAKWFGSI